MRLLIYNLRGGLELYRPLEIIPPEEEVNARVVEVPDDVGERWLLTQQLWRNLEQEVGGAP